MGRFVIGAVGIVVVAVALVDIFLTVFNYDGFVFVSRFFQRFGWVLLRHATVLVPRRWRHEALSLGSAGMVPMTVIAWLSEEITGFALIYDSGFGHHSFDVVHAVAPGIGAAFYLSAGALTSLTFGDIIGRTGPYQAALVVQTVIGLATFTIALGYLVTTFGVLDALNDLHNTVRRHAGAPSEPSRLLVRHFRRGEPVDLSDLLQSLSEKLDAYDSGLRRYPVVYYFHTRRTARSIPCIFGVLGELIEELRFGLPSSSGVSDDPWLVALADQYSTTMERLRQNFVGPEPFPEPAPVALDVFRSAYATGTSVGGVDRFVDLQRRASEAAGVDRPPYPDEAGEYDRYLEWSTFSLRNREVVARLAKSLCYEEDLGVA